MENESNLQNQSKKNNILLIIAIIFIVVAILGFLFIKMNKKNQMNYPENTSTQTNQENLVIPENQTEEQVFIDLESIEAEIGNIETEINLKTLE